MVDERGHDAGIGREVILGRPARVLFLEPRLGVGGAERILINLLESFDRTRVKPSLACLFERGAMLNQLKSKDVPVYHDLAKSRRDPRLVTALVGVIRKERPDIIYTCNYPITMFIGRLAGMLAGVNILVVALHTIGYLVKPQWRRFGLKLMSPFISSLVAVSAGQKRYYVETHGIPESKVEVIYGAVDLHFFSPDNPPAPIRADLGLSDDVPIVGIVATLRPEKRHDLFLAMAEMVHRSFPAAHFVVVGDGPERSRLEAMSNERRLTQFVHFLGNRSDVSSVLRSLDICVLCSDPVVETLPQCLLEAMATERPVVSTKVGSIDELVVDEATGFLSPAGDSDLLAKRVLHLLNHPDEAREMGRAGRRRVEEHFSKETMVRRFEDLFERLVLERESRRVGV